MKWRKSPARAAAEGQARQLPLALQPLKNGYLALAPRERNMVLAAATVVTLAVLWWVLLAPALGTLKRVNSERAELDAQWQHMLSLQHEAQASHPAGEGRPVAPIGIVDQHLGVRLGMALDEAGQMALLVALIQHVAAHDDVEASLHRCGIGPLGRVTRGQQQRGHDGEHAHHPATPSPPA